jgi:hypothetical protein
VRASLSFPPPPEPAELRLDVLRLLGLEVLKALALIGLPDDGDLGLNPMREPINCEKKDRLVGILVMMFSDG